MIDNFFIRVDLLVKTGSLIEIYEVKSKSISSKDSFFKVKNGFTEVKKEWSPYIADIAFQYGIIKDFFYDEHESEPILLMETDVIKEDGFLYYIGKDGNLWRASGPESESPDEKVFDANIKKEANYLYYFKDNNIYKSQLSVPLDFKAYMMVLDKDKPSNIDKLNQYFFLKKKNKRVDVELQKLSEAEFLSGFKNELNDSLMTIKDVTNIVELIVDPPRNQAGRGDYSDQLKFPFTNTRTVTFKRVLFIANYLVWLYKNQRKDSSQTYFDYVEDIGMSGTLELVLKCFWNNILKLIELEVFVKIVNIK